MTFPFVDRLLAYIEGPCAVIGFSKRVRPVAEGRLVEFEGFFGGPIPEEYRTFLARMGEDSQEFTLIDEDMGYFDSVWDWYSDPPGPYSYRPNGESIIIAVGMERQCVLDGGRADRHPVAVHDSGDPELLSISDSLETHCFWRAWHKFRYSRLGDEGGVGLPGASETTIARAVAAAEGLGFVSQPFSDSRHKMLDAEGASVLIIPHYGIWQVYARGRGREDSQRLAESIAKSAGGIIA